MAKELSLSKLTLLYTAGNLASKVLGFAMFFVYTFYISRDKVGYLDLVSTTSGWMAPIIALQIYDSVFRWLINSNDEITINNVVSNSIFILFVSLLFFTCAYLISFYFFKIEYPVLIYAFFVLQTLYPVALQFSRGLGKNMVYVLSGVIGSLAYAITTIIVLPILHLQVEGVLFANILALLIPLLFIGIKMNFLKYFDRSLINLEFTKSLLSYSLPLIPNTLSWWAISSIDRYIILFYLGVSYNGLFAVALKFPSILMMMCSIFYMAWQEKAIKSYHNENKNSYYSEVFSKYFTILFSVIAVLIAVSKPMFRYIVQSTYYEAWKFLPFMYIAVGFQSLSSFYGTGYLSSKNTKGALTTTIFGLIATILFNLLLTKRYALIGTSISLLTGYLTMFLIRVYNTKKYFVIKLPLNKMFVLFTVITIVSLCTISENLIILILNALFAIIFLLLINKEIITEYAKKLLKK